ncbi:tRNA (adenosine(37)-N6)-threonylcarbamoyltransferase complex dimerization subunit type 1 TsaB [Chromohalobacter israelensis]|jgi:tRNA threonylcarbamoyladenosine biosynthesis protein TsaB|uniref:tRNA threonylcarbamoyladenosine biosynthesis protein TsaB n=1 Tax=Chromohalobacter israelensis (strain ATCC BAA-138 / DSM 3043 / CIP 106854 / NCIMB 13768 / 1H11) TaxID=290398 RepID=Q1QZ93_CHRI1|nr:tRNA (adenosine(37)-N6)-threonylcarbamoyltransferase complex dimerization subunit type 1 TsaB [Chromohalobacter salexigens]ABE58215.1 peptidase M22, glycoprotease [Chromohalobacter salexigens DSM 3043]MDO0944290.1 tRNA (adenosine(37)-N6)-threonylcarbamoyltransferase complex dimerization subunit type 1 TsaB [Chromohalobacter salexigens]NWO55906.1 tRNA (adenosine(37)-N6)-threonylcarbamoyltransferase complex dimerization subunit type 1 TsaB [Chromohalobacter salexigens]
MPTLLALDASTSACSCALWRDGHVISRYQDAPRQHTRLLMPMVDDVLAEAGATLSDLDALAYGRGPGSFTGLRIAAGTAQGLAFALDRPLLGISTLDALALAAHRRLHARYVVAALDARMDEIYAAAYRCHDGTLEPLMAETVLTPERLRLPVASHDVDWVGIGSGWALRERMPAEVQAALGQILSEPQPAAEDMVQLAAQAWEAGERPAADEAVPVYLRNEVAWKRA